MCDALRSVEKHFHERSAEPQVPPLRFGRDGKGESSSSTRDSLLMERTADPSAALGMTNRRGRPQGEERCQGTGRLLGSRGRFFYRQPPSPSI